jgi:hypothetical protein
MSSHCSPATIVSEKVLDYKKHCKHEFGEHVQAHAQNDPTNGMAERTIDSIYL